MKKIFFLLAIFYYCYSFSLVHHVTTTNDRGPGSLRQAILDANADSTSPRSINFSISGSGPFVIQPLSPLPAVHASDVHIDGTTQAGWSSGNPNIVVDGEFAAYKFNGITVDGASNCVIRGLVINNGFFHGISVIHNATNTQIYECFLGTTLNGMSARPNRFGIRVSAFEGDHNESTIIGAPGQGNLISGNLHAGIFLSGNVNNAVIQSNLIGTDITGQVAISNLQAGIAILTIPSNTEVSCNDTHIGGSPVQGNLISGNGPTGAGILTGFQPIHGLIIEGNIIGLDSTQTFPLPNAINILMIQSVVPEITGLVIQNNVILP